ncbi:MAG: hypothetical protein GXP41_09405 [Chloroflexi bacterium]|nr:hypothetical protein [Chloroflexota bacterium]
MNTARNTQHATRNTQDTLPKWTLFAGIALLALASVIAYSAVMRLALGRWGFPLDDAWIHQTYARNLAQLGQWAFVPGVPSAGSTAPLWTILLSLAYILPGSFYVWTYLFGAFGLMLVGVGAWQVSFALFGRRRLAWGTALFCTFEWHLVWAGASGMEITLFSGVALILMGRYLGCIQAQLRQQEQTPSLRPLQWGLLAGLLTLIRPEGMMLGALVGGHMALLLFGGRFAHRRRSTVPVDVSVSDLLVLAAGFLLVTGPYAFYNWGLGGTIFPNTFYAKQFEYSILLSTVPLWRRLLSVAAVPWVGAQALLLPGFLYAVYVLPAGGKNVQVERRSSNLLPLAWAGLTILAYAVRLPVTYQHGRYVMPVIPVLIVYGVGGTAYLLDRVGIPTLRKVVMISTPILLIVFWGLGAQTYAQDVSIINCEMVTTAQWVEQNIPPQSMIAAHDIGAMGYFANRPLIDLAGLVTPEIIPILRDEPALQRWLEQRHVPYLVTFADWYTTLGHTAVWQPVYRASCPQVEALGKADMVVYHYVPAAGQ